MTASTTPPGPRLDLDLAAVRERLAAQKGPAYWRGLEELADRKDFQEFLSREFPRHASDWDDSLKDGFDRRRFLQLGIASLGLAGLTACTRQPIEKIVPYVRQPEEVVPGVPSFYATAFTIGGWAQGLLAESHEGRPTKVEGNPQHPASLGGASAYAQATVLELYDPDRAQVVTKLGDIQTWKAFSDALLMAVGSQKEAKGAGLRVLTPHVTSPSLRAQIAALLAKYPEAKWISWEPAGRHEVEAGARKAFGQAVDVRYDFTRADVVVSLDADFLTQGPFAIRYAKDFAPRRRPGDAMNRFYAAESTPTPTGTVADHRVAIRPSAVPALVLALGTELGVPGFTKGAALDAKLATWVAAAAKDLKAKAGVVVLGDHAPEAAHTAVHAINAFLGAIGKTVLLADAVAPAPQEDSVAAIGELLKDIAAKKVDALLVLGGNPLFDSPADQDLCKPFLEVPFRAYVGLYANETAEYCPWVVPEAHPLETWGDACALDGTVTIQQPLIEPLYEGRSALEVLSILLDETPRKAYDVVKGTWAAKRGGPGFEAAWRKALHDGLLDGTASEAKVLAPKPDAVAKALEALAAAKPGAAGSLEVAFRPDPGVYDGRFANSGWLQEIPRPLSKLTWDNAAILAPATAQRLGVASEDVVTVSVGGASVALPVVIQPGQAADVVTLHLGYGRTRAGRVGNGVGTNVNPIRFASGLWLAPSADLKKTGRTTPLSHTQQHFRMEDRALVRHASLEEWKHHPEFAKHAAHLPGMGESMFQPGFEYKKRAWGLSIDLSSCTGCNACVVACQAENNIPIVGKEQVRRNREMQWIRIDQYYEGTDIDAPAAIHHQPAMCMQCEQAPCEVVCPVAATVHGAEGLNEMAYNRCVGTRYCSNNCPYHARRFNFLEYNGTVSAVEKLGKNPEVTVRSRGVMEKCTFCIQRVNRARIVAEREGRPVKDGEVRTACQQTCPSDAIVFGDINDPLSAVAALKKDPRDYALLSELNTRPRATYLAKVRNPNPELEAV